MSELNTDALAVIHGFLALPNRAKLQVVDAMNEYFDSNEKEKVRAGFEASFARSRSESGESKCVCCGKVASKSAA